MPRKRASTLPSALIKAFMPKPPRRKRARRSKTPAISVPKAVRAIARATPTIAAPTVRGVAKKSATRGAGTRKSATRKPATRKSPTRKASARPASTRTPARPAPSSTGKGTWRQARFTGTAGTRAYSVYIPHGLRRTTRAPLLIALHGCGQNGLDFAVSTRFNDLADRHQFVIAYPEQSATHNGQRCWNWFRPGHQFRAQGEPAILAGIVRRVVQETSLWRIDPERVYVTGISAGGAMAVVLAATYPELFAAVGVHSAPPYRSASSPANALAAMHGHAIQLPVEASAVDAMPPMIIFQGTLDSTVYSVNARRIADQWLAYYAHAANHPSFSRTAGPAGPVGAPRTATTRPAVPSSARSRRGFTVSRWYVGRTKTLELWVVDGLGHAWSGGSPKGSYSDSRGPRASSEMWKFFKAHRSAAAARAVKAG